MFLALITLGINTKLCTKSLINLSRNALHMCYGGGVYPTPSLPRYITICQYDAVITSDIVSLGKSMGKQQPGFPTRVRQYFMKKLLRFHTAEMGMLMSEADFSVFLFFYFLNIFVHNFQIILGFFPCGF